MATGDGQGRNVAAYQPVTLAAAEGLFKPRTALRSRSWANPTLPRGRLDNPLLLPKVLSFLTYRHWSAEVKGLRRISRAISGRITCLCSITASTSWWGWGPSSSPSPRSAARLADARPVVRFEAAAVDPDALVAVPVYRQHGRLDDRGAGPPAVADLRHHAHRRRRFAQVSAGNVLFTLVGFMGVYMVLGMLWLFLVYRELEHGPEGRRSPA